MQENLVSACNPSFRRKKLVTRKKQLVYWWNHETAEARRVCLKARRETYRANKSPNTPTEIKERLHEAHKNKKKALGKLIEMVKRKVWEKIVEELEGDIWDSAVMFWMS